jgi:hypothetical protein
VQIPNRDAREDAPFQGTIDLQICLRRITIGGGVGDAENDRPMENQEKREQPQQGTGSPPPPGARAFIAADREFIHRAQPYFSPGKEQPPPFCATKDATVCVFRVNTQ